MRFLIHGLKSLVRRPAKTVMLFIILFVVFNLIFTGFIVQNSIDRSKDYIRSQIGSAVGARGCHVDLFIVSHAALLVRPSLANNA